MRFENGSEGDRFKKPLTKLIQDSEIAVFEGPLCHEEMKMIEAAMKPTTNFGNLNQISFALGFSPDSFPLKVNQIPSRIAADCHFTPRTKHPKT